MLPIDFSIIGTAHSHPSGRVHPSIGDLHNFYGRVMVIMGKPYKSSNVAAFTKQGENIPVRVIH
jgi:proteasome lid subunit RPN8/RPN11